MLFVGIHRRDWATAQSESTAKMLEHGNTHVLCRIGNVNMRLAQLVSTTGPFINSLRTLVLSISRCRSVCLDMYAMRSSFKKQYMYRQRDC